MKKELEHGMLLDGKAVMDGPFPMLWKLRELVPEKLHDDLDRWIADFEKELAECDVSDRFTEV